MHHHPRRSRRLALCAAFTATTLFAACGSDDSASTQTALPSAASTTPADTEPAATNDEPGSTAPASTDRASTDVDVDLTLVAYDSFPVSGTTLDDALAGFTASTGIGVEVVTAGDTGTMLTKAELTAGNPEGDVMWGIDNTVLSRAIDGDVFTPYTSPALGALAPGLTDLVPGGELTPVDFGDVCLNYDIAWFADHDLAPPTTLDDLLDPAYEDLLVVENPASSSPGLAFLLSTVAEYGEDGWQQYWTDLRANGVDVVDSWDSAYYEEFSGASEDGTRPLVVSYASSPPAEVIFADPPRDDAPTAMIADTCFRQIEFAGILRGTTHEAEARRLVDFLIGETFQTEIPLNLFVYPARADVVLPDAFTEFSEQPASVHTVAPADIAANRETWIDEWTQVVLR